MLECPSLQHKPLSMDELWLLILDDVNAQMLFEKANDKSRRWV